MRRIFLIALTLALSVGAPAPASGAVYWGNGSTIGAANLDGAEPLLDYFTPPFPSGSAGPICGLGVNATHLYWAGAFGIGRVSLDGPVVAETVVPNLSQPCGLALGASHLYWANPQAGTIGRAALDGTEANGSLIAGLDQPCGVAVDAGHVYWVDFRGGGRANLDGSGVERSFVPRVVSCGLAVDAGHLYWGDTAGPRSIGRAGIDGSGVDPGFIATTGTATGIASAPGQLLWTQRFEGMVFGALGRAALDGGGANQQWIATDQFAPSAVAVDSRATPPPRPLPSRPIYFGKLRRDLRTGGVTVDVWVPERGDLVVLAPKLGWKVLKGTPPPPWRGGSFRWRLKLWPGKSGGVARRIRRQLARGRPAPVTLRVAYNETRQAPVEARKRIAFVRAGPRRSGPGPARGPRGHR